MKIEHVLIILLIGVMLFLTPAPRAYSYNLNHDVSYLMEGKIDYKKKVGHRCNTGAEIKQVITGDGWFRKFSNIYMQENFVQLLDNNDWVTAIEASQNIEVTSTIDLCAPGKYIYDDNSAVPVETLYPMLHLGYDDVFNNLTDQVWAINLNVEPGYSGSLHTGFDAAYGPYAGAFFLPFDGGMFVYLPAERNEWRFFDSPNSTSNVEWGPDYVGNYFTIQQYALNTYGITRRYIDMSSPWSHAYLREGFTVAGRSEVRESFSMHNHVPAPDRSINWSNLF